MNLRRLSLKNLQDREYLSGRFIGFTEWVPSRIFRRRPIFGIVDLIYKRWRTLKMVR
jgi:hypothetical protein